MYTRLLSPVRIGNLELRNRIAMAPMGVEIVDDDGHVREPVVRYYAERARGGVGLVITENTAACYPRGANTAHEIGVSNDAFLPGLRSLTDAVHEHGAKIAIQLVHHGKVGRLDTRQGRELLMPSRPKRAGRPSGPLDLTPEEISAMLKAGGGGPPRIREATAEDLAGLVEDFAAAAARARRAGFDAIELHGAHGYLFSEFLSPAANFREDEYGGSIENRARLLCEVLRACKARAGPEFPIWFRLDAVEFGIPGGITLADACDTAELLAAAGSDAIHVSAYADPLGAGFTQAPLVHAEAGYAEFAAEIKARVNVPVIAVGRIEPSVGERMLADGHADVIAMGRKLLADPELVAKLAEGRSEDVRPCIYCYVCVAQPFFDRRVRCAVNLVTGQELEFAERVRTPAAASRRVLVVGGGPSGMEAARVAALRGHDVVLCERSDALGGTLRFAALVYEPNERLLRWFETQLRKLPVELRLGCSVTPALLRELAPDVVIAAVGARREKSTIPGAERPHVFDGDALRALLAGDGGTKIEASLGVAARLALRAGRAIGVTRDPQSLRLASRAWMPLGQRVAIIGGGLVGAELAEFLVQRGREVTLLDEGPIIATEMAHPRRWRVLFDLREAGVKLFTGARVLEIGDTTLRFEVTSEASPDAPLMSEIPADSILLATGLGPNPEPVAELRRAGVEVVVVGDAQGVGYIEGAIRDGFRAALEI